MTTLQAHYRKNGYDYDLIQRNDHVAMYLQRDKGRHVAFEIGYIKIQKEATIGGNLIEGGEAFWGNEAFGRTAWVKADRTSANALYAQLTANAQEKAILAQDPLATFDLEDDGDGDDIECEELDDEDADQEESKEQQGLG